MTRRGIAADGAFGFLGLASAIEGFLRLPVWTSLTDAIEVTFNAAKLIRLAGDICMKLESGLLNPALLKRIDGLHSPVFRSVVKGLASYVPGNEIHRLKAFGERH
jgi:hypothetical protein